MYPARAIFVGIHVLLSVRIPLLYLSTSLRCFNYKTASGVNASYDSLVNIFECVGNFLNRVQIYAKIPLTPAMMGVIVEIMAELLSVLALTTTQIKQGRLSKSFVAHGPPSAELAIERFIRRLFGDPKIEAVLQRLDRLTQEEARMATVQTLELVHGLVKNVGVVMDGGQTLLAWLLRQLMYVLIDGKISADLMRQVLGVFRRYHSFSADQADCGC